MAALDDILALLRGRKVLDEATNTWRVYDADGAELADPGGVLWRGVHGLLLAAAMCCCKVPTVEPRTWIPDGQEEDEYTRILRERGEQGLKAYIARRDAEHRKTAQEAQAVETSPQAVVIYRPIKNHGRFGTHGILKPATLIVPPAAHDTSELKKQLALMEEEDIAMILMLMAS